MPDTSSHRRYWRALKPGDIVDVVAPSWGVPKPTLKQVEKFLSSLGLQARYPKDILGKDILCANSLNKRTDYLLHAFQATDSAAVWSLRGGHGAAAILPALYKLKTQKPKLFIGLSDITSLHLFLHHRWGWATIHGPNLNWLQRGIIRKNHLVELERVILGKQRAIEFTGLKPMNAASKVRKKIKGKLLGGNLTVCTSLIGTKFLPPTFSGKILFFEEVGERAYRLDRMLVQWEQAGLLKGVQAVVLGDVTEGEDPDGKDKTSQILRGFAESQDFPVLSGIPCGHGDVQRPVPLGTRAVLELGPRSKLICEVGCS